MKKELKAFNAPQNVDIVCEPAVAITAPDKLANQFRSLWADDIGEIERAYALFLNHANKVKAYCLLSVGGLTNTVIDGRILWKRAIDCMATSVAIAHNHPSGKVEASIPDVEITKTIKQQSIIMNIRLLDHLIIAPDGSYYSFAENGEI